MPLNWTNYVLPGDIKSTAKEIDAADQCINLAINHLLKAHFAHRDGDFEKARHLVNRAVDRLEDWERSDNEMLGAFDRKVRDMRFKRMQMIEHLSNLGADVMIVERGNYNESL